MKLPIVTYPDNVLAAKCEPVTEIDDELNELIDNMVETMYEDDGVGLAAPQVGKSIRLITVDQTGPRERSDLMVLINPVITERDGLVESEESCLSCPGFSAVVDRSDSVTLEAQDREGKPIKIEAEALLAIILQHEMDHLDGVTLVDKVGRIKRGMYLKKVNKARKKQN